MNITWSNTIDTLAVVYIQNNTVPMTGAFANYFKVITLDNNNPILRQGPVLSYQDVELNANLKSAVFIEGFVIFKNKNLTLACPTQLRRTAGW